MENSILIQFVDEGFFPKKDDKPKPENFSNQDAYTDKILRKYPFLKSTEVTDVLVFDSSKGFIFKGGNWKLGIWEGYLWEKGIWWEGIWKDGTWKDGTWKDGTWENGIWENGFWEKGKWEKGTWNDGIWMNGIWEDGTWKTGYWLGGTWNKGKWEGGKWKEGNIFSKKFDKMYKTRLTPIDFFAIEDKSESEINFLNNMAEFELTGNMPPDD